MQRALRSLPRDGAVGALFNSPDPSHGWEILEQTKHQSDGLLRIYGCFLLKKKTLFLAWLVEQFLDSIDGKFRATKLHNGKHTHTLTHREGTQTYGRAMHKHAQCWFQLNYMSVFTLHHSSIGMVLPFAWALPFMAFGNGRSLLMTHTRRHRKGYSQETNEQVFAWLEGDRGSWKSIGNRYTAYKELCMYKTCYTRCSQH